MTEQRQEPEEELERVLDILDGTGSDDEKEMDGALRTLVGLVPPVAPRHGFSERVITAVRSAPLAAGRRKLRSRRGSHVVAVIGAAAVALVALLWAMPSIQVFVGQVFLGFVQGSVSAIRWVHVIPEALRWIDLTTRPLTEVMSSTQMLTVFAAVMLLSLLVLAALQRVVSASRPERTGY